MKIKMKWVIVSLIIAVALTLVLFLYTSGSANNSANLKSLSTNVYFRFNNGTNISLSSYVGKTVLVYFVTTWCSTCAQGTSLLAQNMGFFRSHNITVLEIELYNDLGVSGPSVDSFIQDYANNSGIIDGYSSYGMTAEFDSAGILEDYYLISPSGSIVYTNSPLLTTFPALENFIKINL